MRKVWKLAVEMRQNATMQIAPFRSLVLLMDGCFGFDSSACDIREVRDEVARWYRRREVIEETV